MTVPWKAWKTKYGFFHASHRPLKIPQNRRDFHIPTAQACTAWKSGKPTTGFPLSHPVHAMTTTVLSLNRKTKRKEVGRYAASSFFMPLSLRSSGTDFMLILQLENAPKVANARGDSGKTSITLLLVDHVDQRSSIHEPLDILLESTDHSLIIAIRPTCDVRCNHHVIELPQRVSLWQWLRIGDIHPGAREALTVERLHQAAHVVDTTAAHGNEIRLRLHQLELAGAHHLMAFLGMRRRDEHH